MKRSARMFLEFREAIMEARKKQSKIIVPDHIKESQALLVTKSVVDLSARIARRVIGDDVPTKEWFDILEGCQLWLQFTSHVLASNAVRNVSSQKEAQA